MSLAISAGLVPGFAAQDGDAIARVSNVAGPFALGASVAFNALAAGNFGATPPVGGYQITNSITIITGTAPGATGAGYVILPLIPPGGVVRIYNTTGNTTGIMPPLPTQQIDQWAIGAGSQITGQTRAEFVYLGNNRWVSNLLGAISQ